MTTSIAYFVKGQLVLNREAIASRFYFAQFLGGAAEQAAREVFKTVLEQVLTLYVTQILDRPRWGRRKRRDEATLPWRCTRCSSQMRRHFWRNGSYRRGLVTSWGRIRGIKVPLVCCKRCRRGYVKISFPFLRRYLRVWDDLMEQALLHCALGHSLRRQQESLAEQGLVHLGLQTLNRQVNLALKALPLLAQEQLQEVPPLAQFDGIYFGVMERTRQPKRDARGRKRSRLRYRQRVALVALGLWPDGRHQLLGWRLADSESEAAWTEFLLTLYYRGLTPEQGLRLAIGDGALGLKSALDFVYYGQMPFQLCIFHKIKRVGHSENLLHAEHRAEILRDAADVLDIPDRRTCYVRLEAFGQKWSEREPHSVRSLRRNFSRCLTYLQVEGIDACQFARTTSHAERVMLELRKKLRQVGTLITEAGANATLTLLCTRLNARWDKRSWLAPLVQAILEAQ